MSIEMAFVVAWLLGVAYTFGGSVFEATATLRKEGITEWWLIAATLTIIFIVCLLAWPLILGWDKRAEARRNRR